VKHWLNRAIRDTIARIGMADFALSLFGSASRLNPGATLTNARHRHRGTPDGLPIPPADLIFLVTSSTNVSWFLKSGSLAAATVIDSLRRRGIEVGDLDAILDFGCGCGRVLRHWSTLNRTRVVGTDYNARLIDWCRYNLPFARFSINEMSPPLAYADAEFDLVYAFSVFTHLTEDLQRAWMRDLTRVVKPLGHLLISTHGKRYIHRLNDPERTSFEAGNLVVKNNIRSPGTNTCSAYHPFAYVRDHLAAGLQIVDFVPEGALGNPAQDLYVLRRPQRRSGT
jgi:SAM-dependent methyltransferase